jgi:hypothetical protein
MKKRQNIKIAAHAAMLVEEIRDMFGLVHKEAPDESAEECDENKD